MNNFGTRAVLSALRRPSQALAAASLVAITAAACGGSPQSVAHLGNAGTTAAATTATTAPAAAGGPPLDIRSKLVQYSSCMRSHGIADFPSPIVSGNDVGLRVTPDIKANPHFPSARAACRHLLPVKFFSSQPLTPADQQDYLRAAACMRSHGVPDFPDPSFAGGVHFTIPSSIDPRSAQVLAARQVCQRLIPAGLPYSGTN